MRHGTMNYEEETDLLVELELARSARSELRTLFTDLSMAIAKSPIPAGLTAADGVRWLTAELENAAAFRADYYAAYSVNEELKKLLAEAADYLSAIPPSCQSQNHRALRVKLAIALGMEVKE